MKRRSRSNKVCQNSAAFHVSFFPSCCYKVAVPSDTPFSVRHAERSASTGKKKKKIYLLCCWIANRTGQRLRRIASRRTSTPRGTRVFWKMTVYFFFRTKKETTPLVIERSMFWCATLDFVAFVAVFFSRDSNCRSISLDGKIWSVGSPTKRTTFAPNWFPGVSKFERDGS